MSHRHFIHLSVKIYSGPFRDLPGLSVMTDEHAAEQTAKHVQTVLIKALGCEYDSDVEVEIEEWSGDGVDGRIQQVNKGWRLFLGLDK